MDERNGVDLMPEQETKPVNKYLLPKTRTGNARNAPRMNNFNNGENKKLNILERFVDRILS